MTPFGEKLRELRAERGISQKQMARDLGLSAAYLSALEHGKRGSPNFSFVQRVITYFNVIWDDADELIALADLSDPRITIDTSNLSPKATALANKLAHVIRHLNQKTLEDLTNLLDQSGRQ